MLHGEILKSEWYLNLPEIVKKTVILAPPTELYKFKDSGKQCYIISYEESENEEQEVTITVQKTGVGGVMNLGLLDSNKVFGVKVGDLELWVE